MPFSTGMGLDFYMFLTKCKKLKKSHAYISGKTVHSQKAMPRLEQTDRKRTFRKTTILQAGQINQVDNECF